MFIFTYALKKSNKNATIWKTLVNEKGRGRND
jgi:hypothetical protein